MTDDNDGRDLTKRVASLERHQRWNEDILTRLDKSLDALLNAGSRYSAYVAKMDEGQSTAADRALGENPDPPPGSPPTPPPAPPLPANTVRVPAIMSDDLTARVDIFERQLTEIDRAMRAMRKRIAGQAPAREQPQAISADVMTEIQADAQAHKDEMERNRGNHVEVASTEEVLAMIRDRDGRDVPFAEAAMFANKRIDELIVGLLDVKKTLEVVARKED